MKKSFSISLANPCSEKWENFQPTPHGGFCQSCEKEVINFSVLTDQQIIDFFKTKPVNTCGRFRPEQLTTYNYNTGGINPGWRLWRAGVLALTFALVSKPSVGQTKEKTSLELKVDDNTFQPDRVVKKGSIPVSGKIYWVEDNSPLPGVRVSVVGDAKETYSDADGKFNFPELLYEKDTLSFMFIGLKTQIVVASQGMTVMMESDRAVTETVVIAGSVCVTNKFSLRRWWWKLKSVF